MWKFSTDDHCDESYRNMAIILVNGKNLYEFNDIVETLGGNIKHGYNITRAKTRTYKIIMSFIYSLIPISFHNNDTILILLDSTVRPLPLPYSLRRYA